MRWGDALVVLANRDRLRGLQEATGAVGQLLEIHSNPLFGPEGYGVVLEQHNPSATLRAQASLPQSAAAGQASQSLSVRASCLRAQWVYPASPVRESAGQPTPRPPDLRLGGILQRPPGPCST